jgi:UDPglucose--hexose-1-phosphate uridylyltransferase
VTWDRRRDPLTGEWRAYSTGRQDRTFLPAPDDCPLCPGHELPWPAFEVGVFDNRFPALGPGDGACEVVVYTDSHTATLPSLGFDRVRLLVDVWADRYALLGARPDIDYVFIFENRGEAVGVTMHHPHGQIYGYPFIPPVPLRELAQPPCGVCRSVAAEADGPRVLVDAAGVVAYAPFAGRMPYEVHVTPRAHAPSLLDLGPSERDDLAAALIEVTAAYDRLFGFPLPYIMSMHQQPTDGGDWRAQSHLHIEFTPLQRRADRLKYLAGSEVGAGAFLVDVSPEDAADALRNA